MRSFSGIMVGETQEMQCYRWREVETTITQRVKERKWRRLIRQLFRQAPPTKTIPWIERTSEPVGRPMWLIGTEEGIEIARPKAL